MSPDGTIIAGRSSGGNPWVWSQASGTQTLYQYLESRGVLDSNWDLLSDVAQVTSIGDGGSSLIGSARRQGQIRSWLFRLDRDDDGIPDAWETAGGGIPVADGSLYDLATRGASPLRKDIFVEADAMNGLGMDGAAKALLIQAFNDAPIAAPNFPGGLPGIALHLDNVEYIPRRPYGLGLSGVYLDKVGSFGNPAERSGANWVNRKVAKGRVFHYAVLCANGNNENGQALQGLGEVWGDDFFAVLKDLDVQAQAGVFMHELGHNLGLRHGGPNDENNFKPNYYSVMNYLWMWPHGWCPSNVWKLRYSDRAYADLCERDLDESRVLDGNDPDVWVPYSIWGAAPPPGPCSTWSREQPNALAMTRDFSSSAVTGPSAFKRGFARFGLVVDWNGNQTPLEGSVSSDINQGIDEVTGPSQTVLKGREDWNHLRYNFRVGNSYDNSEVNPEVAIELTIEEEELLDQLFWPACPVISRASPSYQNICAPATTTLRAGSDGPNISFRWYVYPFAEADSLPGQVDSTLVLTGLTFDAYHRCIVSNFCGRDTVDFYVKVANAPPVILEQPKDVIAADGDSIYISPVMVESMVYSVVWRRNGVVLPQFNQDLYFEPITFADAGVYEATISNGCGSVTTEPFTLLVHPTVTDVRPVTSSFYLHAQNPARGRIDVAFSLPNSTGATLSLYDVAGRRILSREVAGTGPHRLVLGDREALPAGYYVMRLVHEGRFRTARVLMIR